MNHFNLPSVAKKVNKLIEDYKKDGLGKATMGGVYHDLKRLKPIIEKLYDDNIFYLSYWECECGYHGWDWGKDDGSMESMKRITDGITEKVEEIYAMILCGLGETASEDDKGEG